MCFGLLGAGDGVLVAPQRGRTLPDRLLQVSLDGAQFAQEALHLVAVCSVEVPAFPFVELA